MRTDVKVGIAIGVVVVGLVVLYFALYREAPTGNDAGKPPVAARQTPTPAPSVRPTPRSTPASPSPVTPTPIPAPSTGPALGFGPTPVPTPIASRPSLPDWLRSTPSTPSTPPTPLGPVTPGPGPTPIAGSNSTYTVVAGDSLWSIAQKQLGDGKYSSLIAKANPSADPARLKVGEKLTIPPKPVGSLGAALPTARGAGPVTGPGQKVYTVVAGDTGWAIAERELGSGTYWPAITKANPGLDASRLHPGQKLVIPSKAEAESAISGARSSSSSTVRPSSGSPTTPGRPTTPARPTTPSPVPADRPDFGFGA